MDSGPTTAGATLAPTPRRSQAQRRHVTRTALLDASIEVLVQRGSRGFTTTEVCRRANLSQGSLFKHFTTKDDLLAAVVGALFAQLRTEYELRFDAIAPNERSMSSALALLWEQMSDERLHAAFDLYTDARTDPILQRSLQPVVTSHVDNIFELGRDLLGELGGTPDVGTRAVIELAILSMQGLMLNNMAAPDPAARQRLEELLESLAPALFGI